jgi:hypothetical protein
VIHVKYLKRKIMKRNNRNIIFAVFILLVAFNACELNQIPESNLTDAVYWQTDDDFRQAANYLYKVVDIYTWDDHYPLKADIMSDNAVSRTRSNISDGTYLPTGDFGPWNPDYAIIRAANNIIEHVGTTSLKSQLLPEYEAEAKFFRAWAYADLVRRYGDVPLVLKTLDTDDEELYSTRDSRETVTETMYSDLDFAANNLPKASELKSSNWGRVTRGAALALKSRVALREGTWNKFHTNTNFQSHLQMAKSSALTLMQSNEYQLFNASGNSGYLKLFKNTGEGPSNKEAIWVWIYGIENVGAIHQENFSVNRAQGDYSVTRSLVDSYLCTDGLPINRSPLYQGQQDALSEFLNRDPRLNATVPKKGDKYYNQEALVPDLTSPTAYYITKCWDYPYKTPFLFSTYYMDYIAIRYSEVLLIYAEAVYELSDAISDQDLNLSVNLLRDRVGIPHLTNSFVSSNGLNMREEIRRERRVELAMEGFRYDDLLRWKTAEVELPKAVLGARFFKADYPNSNVSTINLTPDSIIIAQPAANRSFDPAKQYLWPIPLNQLALNPNLTQNPNW